MGTSRQSHWIGCLRSGAPPLNFLERQSKHFALDWENAEALSTAEDHFAGAQKNKRSGARKQVWKSTATSSEHQVSRAVSPCPSLTHTLRLVFFLQLTAWRNLHRAPFSPSASRRLRGDAFLCATWTKNWPTCRRRMWIKLFAAHWRVWFWETRRLSATFRSTQEGFNFQSIYFLCLWD